LHPADFACKAGRAAIIIEISGQFQRGFRTPRSPIFTSSRSESTTTGKLSAEGAFP
jgi:hypothetical protein